MRTFAVLCLGLALCGAVSDVFPATRVWRERQRAYHVIHYALDLRLDLHERRIGGTVRMRLCPLKPLTTLEVDAAQMHILGVKELGAGGLAVELPYHIEPSKLVASLPKRLSTADTATIEIAYSATPQTGLFFVHPDSAYLNLPVQAWSQGENELNHYWFPCYDYPNDKATVEMRVTVDDNYTTVSNGALLSVTKNPTDHSATYFWYCAKPIASYLISLIAGDYVSIADHYKSIPLTYNVYPSQADDALRSFHNTPSMIRFFSDKTGFDFPWPKYAQTVVSEFIYGGMENASATTLTDRTLHDARAHLDASSDNLVSHELAHQWFGDLLTCRNWSNAWLNEGFATYSEGLYNEATLGEDDYEHEMMGVQRSVLSVDTGADRRATITDSYVDPEDVFDAHIYARGACILNMLRFVLGDDVFWQGMRHYVDLNQYQCVTTDDFEHAMEDVSHQDLGWFMDEWTVHAGYPVFEVSTSFDGRSGLLHLDVRQLQQVDSLTPLFRMPVRIEVATGAGNFDSTMWIDAARRQRMDIRVQGQPLNIVFDKGSKILKKLIMPKPLSMWLYQLAHGDVGDRIGALDSLAPSIERPEVLAAVSYTLRADHFWGVRQKAAEALWGASEGVHALAPAFSDNDARVRATATASLGHHKMLDALVALGNLFAHDSSYAVQAAALEALVAIDSTHAMEYCNRGLTMPSHGDVIRAAAAKALGSLRTHQAKAKLLLLTTYGQPPDVRSAAIDALVDNWPGDPGVEKRLEDLVRDGLFATQRKAIERLGSFPDPVARNILLDVQHRELNPLLRREARRSLTRLDRVVQARAD